MNISGLFVRRSKIKLCYRWFFRQMERDEVEKYFPNFWRLIKVTFSVVVNLFRFSVSFEVQLLF